MRQNAVGSVARCAIWRHHKSSPEQTFAVNALRIVFEDLVLWNVPLTLHPRSFLVAAAADKRHFQRRNGGGCIFDGFYFVVAVAGLTPRRQNVVASYCFAVKTLRMELLFRSVARPAFDLL